jgi:hypothetical protein
VTRPLRTPLGEDAPAVCPHCWMVNPGPFVLCSRCGASMESHLQESGGLRRTAPAQSPMPVGAGARLGIVTRLVLGLCVAFLALGYLAYLLPLPAGGERPVRPTPATASP